MITVQRALKCIQIEQRSGSCSLKIAVLNFPAVNLERVETRTRIPPVDGTSKSASGVTTQHPSVAKLYVLQLWHQMLFPQILLWYYRRETFLMSTYPPLM